MDTAKQIVSNYYKLNFLDNSVEDFIAFYHPDCSLNWHSSKGFKKLNYDDLVASITNISRSYTYLRADVSHIIEEGNHVSIRFALHGTTIEDEDNEVPLAYYNTIWEVKDGKLYRGFEMSQPADHSQESLNSFNEIKV
ncbi:MAG: nuclear transport factor 2 family protein [Bacteroidia bacterium]|nr:nuclear transport factor 2 family protein [Bacteroidia bacterium]NND25464.1 nuclear transport factor 2 family protein [Flavobacteriaceae bacterium]MBT8278960.1 nuclear transport factor 2 family protein [Bacteroidia bacterium]NNK60634.1 nuclear transport factor 2 family protein [Flavobacteriaceae bacterium]NNL32184.1 nuclear transport factor 2 family protein [Flavobacteriaceae bacterium]